MNVSFEKMTLALGLCEEVLAFGFHSMRIEFFKPADPSLGRAFFLEGFVYDGQGDGVWHKWTFVERDQGTPPEFLYAGRPLTFKGVVFGLNQVVEFTLVPDEEAVRRQVGIENNKVRELLQEDMRKMDEANKEWWKKHDAEEEEMRRLVDSMTCSAKEGLSSRDRDLLKKIRSRLEG